MLGVLDRDAEVLIELQVDMSIVRIGVNLYVELEVLMSYTIVAIPRTQLLDIIVPVTNPRLDGAMSWPAGC